VRFAKEQIRLRKKGGKKSEVITHGSTFISEAAGIKEKLQGKIKHIEFFCAMLFRNIYHFDKYLFDMRSKNTYTSM
jgi:hypothetical protein